MTSRLSVEFVSLPPEREAQWWSAMRWLVGLMKKERERSWGHSSIGIPSPIH